MYPQSGVHQGYIERPPSLYEILGGEYEPCFAHNTGYQFFVTVDPSNRLIEWHLTCSPEKANGVIRHKLYIPVSKNPEDDRTFTVLWTRGKRKNKMTVWMPEEVLRNPSAIKEYGRLCKSRLLGVIQWIENRYDCIIMFEKRLGRPHYEFPMDDLEDEKVQVGREEGEDEWLDRSKKILSYETDSPIKASTISARAKNAEVIAIETVAAKEREASILAELTEMKGYITLIAEGQLTQGESIATISDILQNLLGIKKPEPEQEPIKESDPGVMFR